MNPATVDLMTPNGACGHKIEADRGHMAPYEINVLLHYYYSPEDYPDMDSELFRPTMGKFYRLGLVDSGEGLARGWELNREGPVLRQGRLM